MSLSILALFILGSLVLGESMLDWIMWSCVWSFLSRNSGYQPGSWKFYRDPPLCLWEHVKLSCRLPLICLGSCWAAVPTPIRLWEWGNREYTCVCAHTCAYISLVFTADDWRLTTIWDFFDSFPNKSKTNIRQKIDNRKTSVLEYA